MASFITWAASLFLVLLCRGAGVDHTVDDNDNEHIDDLDDADDDRNDNDDSYADDNKRLAAQ